MNKDIVGAMAKEREYLSFRMKGEEPYHLVNAVKEFGFESLKEYFEAKWDYEISKMSFDVVETTPERYTDDLFACIKAEKNVLLLCNVNETVIAHGNNTEFNTEYCNECGYKIFPLYSAGGAIVFTEGDLAVGLILRSNKPLETKYMLDNIAKIISKYTTKKVEVSGNDILAGGKKISGSTTYEQNDMRAIIFNLSFSDKADLINKICTKHSTKQPGYIDFMNREDFKREVEKWLKVQ